MMLGVPLISPVEESMLSPVGKEGCISHDVTAPPPPTVGETGVIAVPLVSVNELGL